MGCGVTIICDKHVFAHRGQYRTLLASDRLAPEELSQLEQFQFGQSNDAAYLDSLRQDPGLILRPLSTQRYALTRVTKGPQDASGRSTLAFVTLVFDRPAWESVISSNLMAFVSSGGATWDGRTAQIEIKPLEPFPLGEGYSVRVADAVVRSMEDARRAGVGVLCYADTVTLSVLSHIVATRGPDDLRSFSFCYRALTDGSPVELCAVDRRYVRSGTARPAVWFDPPPARGGSTVPTGTAASPITTQSRSAASGPARRPASAGVTGMNSPNEGRGAIRLLFLCVLLTLGISAATLWRTYKQGRASPDLTAEITRLEEKVAELEKAIKDVDNTVVEQTRALGTRISEKSRAEVLDPLLKEVTDLRTAEVDPLRKDIAGMRADILEPARLEITDIKKAVETSNKRIEELKTETSGLKSDVTLLKDVVERDSRVIDDLAKSIQEQPEAKGNKKVFTNPEIRAPRGSGE